MKPLFATLFLTLAMLLPTLAQSVEETYQKFFADNMSLMVDSRLDFRYLDYKEPSATMQQDYRFQFADLNIHSTGQLSENIGFEFMLRFNSNAVNDNQLLDNVKRANISYTTDDGRWYFNAGRFFMKVGSAEQSYWGNDVYTYSVINNNMAVYKTGVTAQYNISGQSIGLQIVNSDIDTDMQYNVYWYGSLMDGFITPLVNYSYVDNDAAIGVTHFVDAGAIWDFDPIQLDTDVAYARNSTAMFVESTAWSMPFRLAYTGDKFRPYLKYIYNSIDFADNTTLTDGAVHTYEAALQYYPLEGRDIRFHLVGSYTSNQNLVNDVTTPDSDARNHENAQYQILAGVRVRFDARKGW